MTEEHSTYEHLSVVTTNMQIDQTQTSGGNMPTPSTSRGIELYFESAVVIIGFVGTAANALVLYAMVASKQHKKHVLVFNQNALDLYSCLLLVITYLAKLFNVQSTGSVGYSLCMILLSENLLWWGIDGSVINLVFVTIERYLKVVHAVWSKTHLRNWITYVAAVCAWLCGITYNMALCYSTTDVVDGVCYGYMIWSRTVRRFGCL